MPQHTVSWQERNTVSCDSVGRDHRNRAVRPPNIFAPSTAINARCLAWIGGLRLGGRAWFRGAYENQRGRRRKRQSTLRPARHEVSGGTLVLDVLCLHTGRF